MNFFLHTLITLIFSSFVAQLVMAEAPAGLENFSNEAPEGFTYDEEGRLVSAVEPKKTRIYIGVDKSGSMRSYAGHISQAARSLVSGLSERACADWEVVVYEIGGYSRSSSFAYTTDPRIITSSTRQALEWINYGITSDSRLRVGQEAPLNSLLQVIENQSGTFGEVDLVASIMITDTLIFHEPSAGNEVASSVQDIVQKPFKSWSFNVFPGNIGDQCSADIFGTENASFNSESQDFLHDCLVAHPDVRYSSETIRQHINGRSNLMNSILSSTAGRYCERRMISHMGSQLNQHFDSDPNEGTYQELINFNEVFEGVSAPLCQSNFSHSFSAITSSILENLGCRMLYLM